MLKNYAVVVKYYPNIFAIILGVVFAAGKKEKFEKPQEVGKATGSDIIIN